MVTPRVPPMSKTSNAAFLIEGGSKTPLAGTWSLRHQDGATMGRRPAPGRRSQRATAGPFIRETGAREIAISTTGVTTVMGNTERCSAPSDHPPDGIRLREKAGGNLPTPIRGNELLPFLVGYCPRTVAFLREGFEFGFTIPFEGPLPVERSKNLVSAGQYPHVVSSKLQIELQSGRVAGPFLHPPFEDFVTSPIGLVPKKVPGEYRLIHHLSHPNGRSVNSGIDKTFTSVSYHSVDNAIDLISELDQVVYLAKTDVKSAFRIIPVNPDSYHLLGFQWQQRFYYDRTLPMGLSASCQIFESFSTAIQWVAQTKLGLPYMFHILDDFLIINTSLVKCQDNLDTFTSWCSDMGIPLAPEKNGGAQYNSYFCWYRVGLGSQRGSTTSG